MSADAAQAHFEKLFGPEFGHGRALGRVELNKALDALEAPNANLRARVVHIAGTNGKGSTLAFLRAILESAEFTIDAFTKPHLMHLNERFRIAGEIVPTTTLIAAANAVKATGADLTHFEAQIAVALTLFERSGSSFVLFETGMGGRDDATNVVPHPALAILTPIDRDHQEALGASIAEIAAHKAGIIKRRTPIVSARQHPDALRVIEETAAALHAPLHLCGRDWDAFARDGRLIVQTRNQVLDLPPPALHGAHQIDNAGLAAAAALVLADTRITDDALAEGIAAARHPARLERLRGARGEIWLDGAHNAHGARALAAALAQWNKRAPRETLLILGMSARKDAASFLAEFASGNVRVIAAPIAGAPSIAADDLANAARRLGLEAEAARDLEDALARAAMRPASRVLISGSLALAGEAYRRFGLTIA